MLKSWTWQHLHRPCNSRLARSHVQQNQQQKREEHHEPHTLTDTYDRNQAASDTRAHTPFSPSHFQDRPYKLYPISNSTLATQSRRANSPSSHPPMDLIVERLNMTGHFQTLSELRDSLFVLISRCEHADWDFDALCVFGVDHGRVDFRDGGEGRAGLGSQGDDLFSLVSLYACQKS